MTQDTNSLRKCAAIVVLAAAAGFLAEGAWAGDALGPSDEGLIRDARLDALTAQVRALQEEVKQLRAGGDESWLTERRAGEIRSLVHDVLADADTRASLLGDGITAGWDNGFYLTSADGNFRLNIKGAVQVRFAYNTQNNGPTDNDRWGFENRRTALKFGGHVVDPSWKYFIHGNFSAGTGMFALLDAFAEKDLGNGWSVRGGKFKLPFMREQLVAYTKLLPVERSLVSSAYGAGRSQGVRVAYQGDRFNFAAAVSDGLGGIGGTTATAITYDTEYAVSARVETLLDGGWKQFGDFTSFNDDEYGLLIGAALHLENGEYGTAAIESQILRWTMDASVEFGGANVFAALVANHVDPNTGGGPSLDQYGLIVQGGLLVTDDLEVFGRYEWSDDDAATENLSLITIGVVKYFKTHQLKWTNDVGVALSEVTGMFADAGASWRTDTPGQDGQVVFRSQFQLVF